MSDILICESCERPLIPTTTPEVAIEELAQANKEIKKLRAELRKAKLIISDLEEPLLEEGVIYRDDNGELRFTKGSDLVGEVG